MKKNLYQFIFKILTPFIIWTGYIYMPFSRKKVKGEHYYAVRKDLREGDVLLSTTRGEFSNFINPEEMKHGAICVGDVLGTGVFYVLEATKYGVNLTPLATFMLSKDHIQGFRPTFFKDENMLKTEHAVNAMKGKPYDYLFAFSQEAMYCFEVVANFYFLTGCEVTLNKYEKLPDLFIYSCQTFSKSHNFNKLFDTKEMEC